MEKKEKPPSSSASSVATGGAGKPVPEKPEEGESPTANDLGQGVDRPGFDLDGSTGETHAGTGLGLGTDAFDTPGDRSLPGRKLDNHLTIPRWSGPEPRETIKSDEKTAGAKTPSTPEKKKAL